MKYSGVYSIHIYNYTYISYSNDYLFSHRIFISQKRNIIKMLHKVQRQYRRHIIMNNFEHNQVYNETVTLGHE